MDIKRLLNDAGSAFNRVIQQAEEKLFDVERTEYEDDYTFNIKKLDVLIKFTNALIDETESLIEPNPAYRLEGKLMERIERKSDRSTPLENMGIAFENASVAVKQFNNELYQDFSQCGKYEIKLGFASKEFQNNATDVYVYGLRNMLDEDLRIFKEEEYVLENLRLDYDSLRKRIKTALTPSRRETLEIEFARVKEIFENQMENSKHFFKRIDDYFDTHRDLLWKFVELQSKYYMDCYGDLERLKYKMETRDSSPSHWNESDPSEDDFKSIKYNKIFVPRKLLPDKPKPLTSRRILENPKTHEQSDKWLIIGNSFEEPQSELTSRNIVHKFVSIVGEVHVNVVNHTDHDHNNEDYLYANVCSSDVEMGMFREGENPGVSLIAAMLPLEEDIYDEDLHIAVLPSIDIAVDVPATNVEEISPSIDSGVRKCSSGRDDNVENINECVTEKDELGESIEMTFDDKGENENNEENMNLMENCNGGKEQKCDEVSMNKEQHEDFVNTSFSLSLADDVSEQKNENEIHEDNENIAKEDGNEIELESDITEGLVEEDEKMNKCDDITNEKAVEDKNIGEDIKLRDLLPAVNKHEINLVEDGSVEKFLSDERINVMNDGKMLQSEESVSLLETDEYQIKGDITTRNMDEDQFSNIGILEGEEQGRAVGLSSVTLDIKNEDPIANL